MVKNKYHHTISAKDLNLKLKFERKFKKKLKNHFKKISSEFKKTYEKDGKILDTKDHREFIHSQFLKNYVSVSERFSKSIRDRIGNPDNNSHIQNRIDMTISNESVRNTAMYAQDVVDTTAKNMTSAVDRLLNFL